MDSIQPVRFDAGKLSLIDQTRLPGELAYVTPATAVEVAQAIRQLVVRGAPAIGIAAAFGVALAAREVSALPAESQREALERAALVLKAARPTAVNLAWAVDRMMWRLKASIGSGGLGDAAVTEAQAILEEDLDCC